METHADNKRQGSGRATLRLSIHRREWATRQRQGLVYIDVNERPGSAKASFTSSEINDGAAPRLSSVHPDKSAGLV